MASLVLAAARDVEHAGSAFEAETLISTLLGTVYERLAADRATGQAEFLAVLDAELARTDTRAARLTAAILESWRAPAGGSAEPPAAVGGDTPWLSHLGRLSVRDCHLWGDRYGDQSGHLMIFGYDDARLGGPDHAILVTADHNAGMATDIVVTEDVALLLDGLRNDVGPDRMHWLTRAEPGVVRTAAHTYLRLADRADVLPSDGSLAMNRALTMGRLGLLPDGSGPADPATSGGTTTDAVATEPGTTDAGATEPGTTADPTATDARGPDHGVTGPGGPVGGGAGLDRTALVDDFLDSPEAYLAGIATATGAKQQAARYCADLIVDFAVTTRGGDPLRLSPTAVDAFLLDWVHPRAVLDTHDVAMLPMALAAWVVWAARLIGLPDPAVRGTVTAIRGARAEFKRLCSTGERQSPATRATARMVAQGVDPGDDLAVRDWLSTHSDDA